MIQTETALGIMQYAASTIVPHHDITFELMTSYAVVDEGEDDQPMVGIRATIEPDGEDAVQIKHYLKNVPELSEENFALWCHGYMAAVCDIYDAVRPTEDGTLH